MDISLQVGSTFDKKFEILAVAGQGGMGTVYKARQLGLDRLVALKVLRVDGGNIEKDLKRFEREARSIAALNHENIAKFHSYSVSDSGLPYISMEYLEGKTLRRILSEEDRLNPVRASRIVRQVCSAMKEAHEAGLLHRDIKPDNIILLETDSGEKVKILDFGLAKVMESSKQKLLQKLTGTGQLIGSVNYMSPELSKGNAASGASDIYALGCTFFELLTGRTPFDADNPIGLLHLQIFAEVEMPSKLLEEALPPGFDLVVWKSLAKKLEDRYQSMAAFEADLELLETNKGSEIQIEIPEQNAARPNTVKLLLLSLSVVVLFFGAVFYVRVSGEGMNYIARLSLHYKPDKSNQKYWLEVSDSLEDRGGGRAATELQAEVARMAADKTALISMYLELAKKHLNSGDKQGAQRWALRALYAISGTGKDSSIESKIDAEKALVDSASILLASDCVAAKPLRGLILNLLEKFMYHEISLDSFYELVWRFDKKLHFPGRKCSGILRISSGWRRAS